MGAKKPRASAANPEPEVKEKSKTEVVRAPEELAEMLEVIAQHRINGWGSVPAILRDDDCPLRDWLLPFYAKALEEKGKRLKEIRESH